MSEEPEPTLTDEEAEQGWRLVRLGSGPWRKVPPGTKLAADYLREHRARVKGVRPGIAVMGIKRRLAGPRGRIALLGFNRAGAARR